MKTLQQLEAIYLDMARENEFFAEVQDAPPGLVAYTQGKMHSCNLLIAALEWGNDPDTTMGEEQPGWTDFDREFLRGFNYFLYLFQGD